MCQEVKLLTDWFRKNKRIQIQPQVAFPLHDSNTQPKVEKKLPEQR